MPIFWHFCKQSINPLQYPTQNYDTFFVVMVRVALDSGSSKEMGFLNPNFPFFGESRGAV